MNSYDKTTWVNGAPPALNAAHLNKIEDALAEVIALANDNHVDLDKKVEYVTSATVDNATDTGKVYYTTTDKALIIPVSAEFSQAQFRLARDGKIYARRRSRSSTSVDFPAWGTFEQVEWKQSEIENMIATYLANVKVQTITAQSTHDTIPTSKSVYDFVAGYAPTKADFSFLENQYTDLLSAVAQKPSVSQVQQMIDNSIGGVLSGEY